MIEEYNLMEVSEVLIENVIFGAENSSSSHTDNVKKNFLVLGIGSTFGITVPIMQQKKTLVKHIQITLLKFTLQW